MLKRIFASKVLEKLETNPAVALLGPRQIGKTTLAHAIAADCPSLYLDLESPQDLAKLQDPEAYLRLQNNKLVILDEIQRYPDLFLILRGIIDQHRREGFKQGQFLLLGSASIELIKQSSESLAGRITYLELGGLTPKEVGATTAEELNKLWLRGGFPESYLANTDLLSSHWREDFIRTYLERDIPQLGPKIPSATLRRFWTMLAHCQASLFNASKLAVSLEISNKTVSRYLDLLVDLLLVRRLEPWHSNTKKRLVKAPKIYLRDTGLLHQLLNIPSFEALLGNPIVGASWEGFVIENLLSAAPQPTAPSFYRTATGNEIDLILQLPNNQRWAIEIKRGSAPKIKSGFYSACDDLKPTHQWVVYSGAERFPLPQGVEAISLLELMQELEKLS